MIWKIVEKIMEVVVVVVAGVSGIAVAYDMLYLFIFSAVMAFVSIWSYKRIVKINLEGYKGQISE